MTENYTRWYVPAPFDIHSLGIPDERKRYLMRKMVIGKKLNTTLLPAMRRHGIDMWLVLSREFHPDPVLPDIGGGWPGVRNAYIFFDNGGEAPEKIFIGSHGQREDLFDSVYDQAIYYGYSKEGLAPHLKEIVQQRDPQRIGVNMSPTLPMADGLSAKIGMRVFYYVIPNLDMFNLRSAAVHGLPIEPARIATGVLYAVAYSAGIIFLAMVVFRRRELP